jgi:hypothetical protein
LPVFREPRRLGITVRKTTDCFIATYGIVHRRELLHSDADFGPFEAHLGLLVIHPDSAKTDTLGVPEIAGTGRCSIIDVRDRRQRGSLSQRSVKWM